MNSNLITVKILINTVLFKPILINTVTGLSPDYTIPGLWPELTLLALGFRQEPSFITVNSGVRPS